jgi:hypothetical protein
MILTFESDSLIIIFAASEKEKCNSKTDLNENSGMHKQCTRHNDKNKDR